MFNLAQILTVDFKNQDSFLFRTLTKLSPTLVEDKIWFWRQKQQRFCAPNFDTTQMNFVELPKKDC